jgi:hypothetical protein
MVLRIQKNARTDSDLTTGLAQTPGLWESAFSRTRKRL